MGKEIRGDKALPRVVHPWRTAGVVGFKQNTVGALFSCGIPVSNGMAVGALLGLRDHRRVCRPGLKIRLFRWGLSTADQNKIGGKMSGLKIAGGGQEIR